MKRIFSSILLTVALLAGQAAPALAQAQAAAVPSAKTRVADYARDGAGNPLSGKAALVPTQKSAGPEGLAAASPAGEVALAAGGSAKPPARASGGGQAASDADPRLPTVNVAAKATRGGGTAASPWAGWDTAINWAERTTYYFPKGYYSFASTLNVGKTGLELVGEAGAVLQHTGPGDAVFFNGTTAAVAGGLIPQILQVRVENLVISGNASTTNLLHLRHTHLSQFRNLYLRNARGSALFVEAGVTNTYDHIWVGAQYGAQTPITGFPAYTANPQYGMRFTTWTGRYPGVNGGSPLTIQSTDSIVSNAFLDGMTGAGIWLESAVNFLFLAGTSEGQVAPTGTGILVSPPSSYNTFIDMDLEGNFGDDLVVHSKYNQFIGMLSTKMARFKSGAAMNTVQGGLWETIIIESGAMETRLNGVTYNLSGGGRGVQDLNADRTTTKIPGGLWDHTAGSLFLTNPGPVGMRSTATSGGVTEHDRVLLVTATSTQTLPAPSTVNRLLFTIKARPGVTVTVQAAGGAGVDGAAAYTIPPNGFATFVSDGAAYWRVG